MSVTVVKGRSGSGKSRFLMAHIKELIRDPLEKVLVLVPGQLTFETEKAIMDGCGVPGIFGLEVLSIQRLACKIIEDTGSCTFMTNAQKALVCSRALCALGHPFRGVSDIPGFEVCVADLISRLKSYNQTPDSLRAAAKGVSDTALREKLIDTADVYEQYLEFCDGRLDASDMYAFATQRAADAAFLDGAHIVVDGLDSYAPAVMGLLERVMAQSSSVIAAFRSEGDGGDAALFASEKKDMERFVAAAKRSGKPVVMQDAAGMESRHETQALKFLEANLYAYPSRQYTQPPEGIALFEAQSIAQEVDILASGILAHVKNGRRFRDMAVVGGGIDTYLPAIKETFSLAGIPYFIDERRSLSGSVFYDFVYKALCAAAGDTAVTDGYVMSRFAPLEDAQRRTLLRYAARYAYRGWHYWGTFWRGDDAADMETLRKRAMAPLCALENGIGSGSAKKQIAAVEAFLSACGAQDKLAAFCESIDLDDTRAQHAYFSQVYEKTHDVLSGIADVYGDTHIPPQTLCDLFATACDATRIAVIPPTADEVIISDISVVRLHSIDVLFAIGVHDGMWPVGDDGAGILSPAERDTMARGGVDIGVFDLAAEKLKIYTALVRPRQMLHLSYNTQTGTPSMVIDRVRRLFPQLETQKPAMPLTSARGIEAALLGEIAQAIHGKTPGDDMLGACAVLLRQPDWADKALTMLLRTNAALPIGTDTAAALYGGRRCSATRIETMNRCPFRHFLSSGIKAAPERDYMSDRMDIGTYMHLALDLFARTLLEDGADIKTLGSDEVIRRMKKAAQQAADEHDSGKLLSDERFALQYRALTRELVDTALRIHNHFEGTNATIHASEQAFSGYTIDTTFGDVEMSGKIDRIDTADGHFRVVDYKSSAKPFNISDFVSGISLQLPIYIAAAARLLGDLRPAGGYYMRIGEKFEGSVEEVDKKARMLGISLEDAAVQTAFSTVMDGGVLTAIDQSMTRGGALNGHGKKKYFSEAQLEALLRYTDTMIRRAAEAIFGGDTAIRPVERSCEYCDYASVCMVSEDYEGNEVRPMVEMDKDELLEVIGNER